MKLTVFSLADGAAPVASGARPRQAAHARGSQRRPSPAWPPHRVGRVVEDRGAEHGVGVAALDGLDQVLEPPGAARGDHRDVDAVGHRAGELELVAVLGPVAIHAREQDLAGAAAGSLAGPLDCVAPGRRAPAVDDDLIGAGGLGAGAGVDGQDDALRAEVGCQLVEQLRPRHRRRVDRDLVGPGVEHGLGVGHRADASTDGEGDEDVVRGPPGELHHRVALVARGGDVEEAELVGPLGLVAHGQLDRVAGVADVDEVRALDHAAGVDVEAGDDALEEHAGLRG